MQQTVLLRAPGVSLDRGLLSPLRSALEPFPSAGTDEIGLDDPAPIEGHNNQCGYLDHWEAS